MTPCEKKGYKVGEVFKVITENGVFSVGSIVVLSKDDGTISPSFDLLSGECQFNNGKNTIKGAYLNLERVVRVYPPEAPLRVGKYDVEINDDGSILVGCQSISFENVKAIYKAAKAKKNE